MPYRGTEEQKQYHRERRRRQRKDWRQAVLTLLGNRCNKCGFSDGRVLQIDHKNGEGSKEVRSFGRNPSFYKHILDVKGLNYQLLCANCNWIKRYENKEGFQIIYNKGEKETWT